ncbi:MAG: exodeoxyribonuclease V subunit gamma [bacterium]|nr:exodeoxyribonuclease V subunit gamma [bacterium]
MLTLHQGNRLEVLVDRLAAVLAVPPDDPLAPEHVVVQNAGMARWLSLELARRHGVCAHVRFAFPAAFLWEMWRRVLPDVPARSPLEPAVATWRLFGLLGGLERDATFAPLHAWMGDDPDGTRRFALAGRLAELYDQYVVYRPDWMRDWEGGADARWQAVLWRRLVAGTDGRHGARLAQEFLAAMAGAAAGDALPARVALFGVPTMPPAQVQAFAALGARSDVHCFVLNPSREHWAHVLSARAIAHLGGDAEAEHRESGNALLASLGQQGRDVIDELQTHAPLDDDCWREPGEATLLEAVQMDVLELRERPWDGGARTPVAAADDSIRLHACHAPMREVEVLHDRLLALFDAHPELCPADVVVMTPDVGTYAPCIEAVFGTAPPERWIPFSIADRSVRAESPLIEAFLRLVDLPDGRWDATGLLALLDVPALRRRFGLDEADLPQVQRWVREAGIRWGIDAAGRAQLGLPPTAEHTWRFGLDRLLLGWALPGRNRRLDGDVLPLDEIEGSAARALGGLAAFADAAFGLDARLRAPRPPAAWAAELLALLDDFFAPGADDDEAVAAARDACAAFAEAAQAAGADAPVSRALVRAELQRALEQSRPRGRFLTGGVTVCAMVPMRSIPFPVVCLLGLDIGSFPRTRRAPGFDLMADDHRRGDRSRRADDRWLFLEAILSARRCLHLSWVGRGIRDNAEIPPSVVVSELLEVLERGFAPTAPGCRTLREQVVVEHPLQPFSRRYFGGDDARLASYSTELCEASRTLRTTARASGPLLEAPLPAPPAEDVGLDRLVDFLAHPTRDFLRERLRLRVAGDDAGLDDREPFGLDGLGAWTARTELLALRRDGVDPDAAERLLRARGMLPHGEMGRAAFRGAAREVEAFHRRLEDAGAVGAGVSVPVAHALADGTRLAGIVPGVFAGGLIEWRMGGLRARDLLGLWVRHLALQADGKGGARSLWLGGSRDVEAVVLHRVAHPGALLAELVALYRRGRCELLRLFPESAYAYQEQLPRGERQAWWAAVECWEGNEYRPGAGESENAWNVLAWRDTDPLDAEFSALARRVFEPLLAAMKGTAA